LHEGGVRGHVIRQKIGQDGQWKDLNEVNFNTVPPDSGISIELDTTATEKLHGKLTALYEVQRQGIELGDQTYTVAKEGQAIVINDATKALAIRELLENGYTSDFWSALIQDKPDLATQLAAARIQSDREQSIDEFKHSLTGHSSDESYWQKFLECHPWMLQAAFSAPVFKLSGETYVGGKTSKGRQGAGGVATDFLFADDSTKSFAVVEIKTPHSGLAGTIYRGKHATSFDNEIYSIHGDLSGGVIQIRNEISVAIEDFQSLLGRDYAAEKLNRVHPKGVLIIGTSNNLEQRQRDSFNHFRHALHSITVITFDELLQRLQLMFMPQIETTS
jgi:hypothetical protein